MIVVIEAGPVRTWTSVFDLADAVLYISEALEIHDVVDAAHIFFEHMTAAIYMSGTTESSDFMEWLESGIA